MCAAVEWDALQERVPGLRRWQQEAVLAAMDALQAGRAGMIVATTGAGKSVFLAALLRLWRADSRPGVVVVTTPTRKLVEQLAATLEEWLGPGVVGRYYTTAKQHKRAVIVCCNPSVPKLADRLAADGIPVALWVADEAHRTEQSAFDARPGDGGGDVGDGDSPAVPLDQIAGVWPDARRLGLTATPFRTDEDATLRLFDSEIYRYAPADALRDGVIVPWRIIGWGDDRADLDVDDACIEMIRELGEARGPGVVNASTIADALAFAERLTLAGILAAPIHSRMSGAAQLAAIADLQAGRVACLVHIAMLVEGVDFPWLRWLCLRRVVGSRVRFIQEVGRALRAIPGKTEAVLLDPNDLFGGFQLTYESALGWSDVAADAARAAQEEEDREASECAEAPDKPIPQAARTSAIDRYVRQLLLALRAEGFAGEDGRHAGKGWRAHPPSAAQIGAVAKMASAGNGLGRVAHDHRAALVKIANNPGALTKGVCSDLIDLIQVARKLPPLTGFRPGGGWSPASPVRIPCADALAQVVVPPDPTVYVCGAMRGGFSAVAIVRDGKPLFAMARAAKRGDTWGTLTESALGLAVARYAPERLATSDGPTFARHFAGYQGIPVGTCDPAANPASGPAWKAIQRAAGM
jgi:superfamily II DNA or RNA helicase